MHNIKKVIITVLLFMIFLLSFFLYYKNKEVNYYPTEYEKELINYFKEIALQSEYDNSTQKVIKWLEPMVLFVKKEEELKPQMLVIKKTINKINQLATDGFKVILTNDFSKSNSVLFLSSKNELAKSAPYFYDVIFDDIDYDISGFAHVEFLIETGVIIRSLIFIDSEASIDSQESTILEEITQSLGLAFDSKEYPNSVFYKNKYQQENEIKEYSKIDRDVIGLLYHPKMKPGLDSIRVERVIKKILFSEKD